MIVECKNCGGKGHVFDAGFLFFGPVGWILGIMERNDSSGPSRSKCLSCKGVGYRNIRENGQGSFTIESLKEIMKGNNNEV